MTEYATTPSAIEEWKTQRSRTADWVQRVGLAAAGLPPTPSTSTDSDWDKRSLWDGNGWEPPSDCESSTSIPPTMMLQYADSRNVVITPTTQQAEGSPRRHGRGHGHGHGHATGRSHTRDHARREEDRTEMARSRGSHSADRSRNLNPASASKTTRDIGGSRSQTSSARHLARAAAAPLPDSHSSHSTASAVRSRSKSRSREEVEADAEAGAEVVNSASHRATSTHSHPSHLLENRAQSKEPQQSSHSASQHASRIPSQLPSQLVASHPPSHMPTHQPSHQSSRQVSRPPSHIPTHPPTHQFSHVPSHQASQQQQSSQNAPSHATSHHPSQIVASHVPSHAQSHHTHPHSSTQPNHPPSAFSNHTAIAPAAAPANPSANGTANGNGVAASHPPPSIHSIQSRSISASESRSSGQQPEPIIVHPPINSPPHSNSNSQTNGVNNTNGVQPQGMAASASLSYVSVPPRQSRVHEQNQHFEHEQQQRQSVAPSHQTSHSHAHSYQNQSQMHGKIAQVHTPNGQLPTPISPTGHVSAIPSAHSKLGGPMRAPSTMSATGLGGGYVLVDVPSPGFERDVERELAERKDYERGKGSGGNKGVKERERGSLFNVFGVGKHNRSRSLPLNGMSNAMPAVEEDKERHHESSADHRGRPTYAQNPYLTPISPLSPTSPQYPTTPNGASAGIDPSNPYHSPPPKIVYAPARHHSATHFSPPRIMYVPASPRKGQRLAPYDTQQILTSHVPPTGTQTYEHSQGGPGKGVGIMGLGQGQTFLYPHPYPSMTAHSSQYPYAYPYQQYGHGGATTAFGGKGPGGSPGSVRRSQTLQEPVRDSGWEEGKKGHDQDASGRGELPDGSAAHEDDHGANAGAHEHISTPVASSPDANLHGGDNTALASPAGSPARVAVVAPSDATRTSQRTNMAGVGTISARSRSRGRDRDGTPRLSPGSPSHLVEGAEHEAETERGRSRERSRSRARGMVYSASAPQPEIHRRSVAPYAAMMVPPGSAVRDRGVRDAPYPTPPGSTSEHMHHQRMVDGLNHHGHADANGGSPEERRPHNSTLSPISPGADVNQQPPSPGGFVSRFRGMYNSSHSPSSPRAVGKDAPYSSPGRGRTRERERGRVKDRASHRRPHINGRGRARSIDSQASGSSASTYYVISTPGQKVRLIRTDGKPATAASSDYRGPPSGGAGSWFKKAGTALRPRFLSRDHEQHSAEHHDEKSSSRTRTHSRDQAPALDSRTPSGGSGIAASTKSGKKGKKLVRRNSTGSSALLSQAASREPSQGQTGGAVERTDPERDVDIVIPGR